MAFESEEAVEEFTTNNGIFLNTNFLMDFEDKFMPDAESYDEIELVMHKLNKEWLDEHWEDEDKEGLNGYEGWLHDEIIPYEFYIVKCPMVE